ncbi:prolyl oligopeptidase family serine peptidase [Gemmatimonas sp.]
MSRAIVVALLLSASFAPSAAAQRVDEVSRRRPPDTRVVNVVGDYHGTRVPDPYRWLENLDAPAVRAWGAAQTAYALPYLRDNAVRSWVLSRFGELDSFWREPLVQTSEPEQPPVDDSTLAAGESLDGVWASADRRYAAYQIARTESDWTEGRIRRLLDGVDLPERLEGLYGTQMLWTRDNLGFFYVRATKPPLGSRAKRTAPGVYYHAVGTAQTDDVKILQLGANVTDVTVDHELSADGRFLFVSEGAGPYVDGLGHLDSRLHVLDLGDPARPNFGSPLVALSSARDAAYRVIATHGDSLFLFTDRGAPRRRLVVMSLRARAVTHWHEVVPPSADVIDQIEEIGHHFVVRYVRNAQHGVRVYERNGRLVRELPIRPMTTIEHIRAGSQETLMVQAVEGFAPTRRRYTLGDGRDTTEVELKSPSPADPYEIRQVWYSAKDGVSVPMFLAHRRGLALDGSHPTILSGYGASSSIEMPNFGTGAIALLELGFVLAAPSLRGGAEFGREWYEAATLGRKQTTFDDFIAAAEFLIRERYTSPSRLAILGGSNGGLLVTSVVNQRPDLFRVAVANAPPTDLLRFDPGVHRAQYGSPQNPEHIPFLRASSALHNVRAGTCYPATLITTSFNDQVVPAWNAFKFTAALQAAQTCDRPVLLRADTTGGHGGIGMAGAGDTFGFIASQLGVRRPLDARR